jgi:2-phosphoglycerate kinase
MMRQIIRCYLAPNVVPTLAFSSFEAWRGLPVVKTAGKRATDSPVIAGFLSQFATVKVALEATIQRAIEEGHHLIVDGVHVVPTELDLKGVEDKAIVVPVMLAVMGKKVLGQQLKRRRLENPKRGSSRHRKHLDAIWDLQSYLLMQADVAGIPIVPNATVEQMVREIRDQITQKIVERYPPHIDVLE